MKKNSKTHPIRGRLIPLSWLPMMFLSLLLSSCQKNKYQWQPGISAPKYYPVGDVKVNFGNAGHGTLTNFDSGWGNEYGNVISGDKYKEIPKEVNISYISAVDNLKYIGIIHLDQKKILNLFRKYNINDDEFAHLVVGMAPGGWIRVWFTTVDQQIEVAKAKLKGIEDNTIGEGFRYKNSDYWRKYKIYWQHNGIPYGAWANNEKEYNMYFDFNNPNKREVEFSYTSQDGTFEQGIGIWKKFHKKLPVEIELGWRGKSKDIFYCSKVIIPKGFKNLVKQKSLETVIFKLEIENDDVHANLFLLSKGLKEKILRFRNVQPTEKEKRDNEYAYASEVEYFIP